MKPWLELLSRRGWFLGIYGIIALMVGALNAWMTDKLGFNALQWLLLSATRSYSSTWSW